MRNLVDNIIAYEDGRLNEIETIALFQHLVDTGTVWQLQGSYGRMAMRLIDAGLVELKNDRTDTVPDFSLPDNGDWAEARAKGGGRRGNLN